MNGCVDDDGLRHSQRGDDGGRHGLVDPLPFAPILVGTERAALPAKHFMPECIFGNAQPACVGKETGDGGLPAPTRAGKDEDAAH